MRFTVFTAFCRPCGSVRHLFRSAEEAEVTEFSCQACGERLLALFSTAFAFFCSEEDEFAEAQAASMDCDQPSSSSSTALDLDEVLGEGGETEVCAICLEPAADARIRGCGHEFHRGCIARWLREGAATCPVCKAPTKRL